MRDPLLTLRDYARLAPWGIRDLAVLAGGILEASSITPTNAAAQIRPSDRTVRFYVTRHLLSSPEGRGTAATYNYRHLLQILAIKLRQMEGVTLGAIARELAESPGDVLEKRVATALGTVPAPEELDFAKARPRGRVGRAVATTRKAAATAAGASAPPPEALDGGAWYRVGLEDGAELALRSDHPAARTEAQRQRVAEALARALRDTAAPDGQAG